MPKLLLNALCVLPFAIAAYLVTGSPLALIAFIGMLGIATGHGQYFSIQQKTIAPEKVDFIVRVLFDYPVNIAQFFLRGCTDWKLILETDPRVKGRSISYYGFAKLRWRNAFGMFVTGSMVGLPAFIVCMSFDHKAAILLFLTGFVKAAAYRFAPDTEAAEWFNGFGRTMLCGLAVCV